MKKTIFLASAVVLIFVCFIGARFFFGEIKEEERLKVGVLAYHMEDTFIREVCQQLQSQGRDMIIEVFDGQGDQSHQNEQVKQLINLNYDVLCINLVDRFAASEIIDRAMEADIPIVFFNREPVEADIKRWEKLYYVGTDAKESAVLQGQMITELYESNPSFLDKNGDGFVGYVMLEGESSHQDSLIRTKWAVQTLQSENVPIKKVAGGMANWKRSQAEVLMSKWLDTHKDEVELVIANNDDMALGAIDAMAQKGMGEVVVVGIDGTEKGKEAVAKGELLGTIACESGEYANSILKLIDSLSRKEMPREKYVWCKQEIFRIP